MNKQLWQLDKIGNKLWNAALAAAQQAAALGVAGGGIAHVAEETQQMARRVEGMAERALFDGEPIDEERLVQLATELNYLAFNGAIESYHLHGNGKGAAVCAEEIRRLSTEAVGLIRAQDRLLYVPRPKDCLTSVSHMKEFLCFRVNGTVISESLDNAWEVLPPGAGQRGETAFTYRGNTVPLADPFRLLGTPREHCAHIIVRTHWAEQNKKYAVAVDELICLYISPIGKPVAPPKDLPLAPYVRECWDNEEGEPYLFMDWPKIAMAGQA